MDGVVSMPWTVDRETEQKPSLPNSCWRRLGEGEWGGKPPPALPCLYSRQQLRAVPVTLGGAQVTLPAPQPFRDTQTLLPTSNLCVPPVFFIPFYYATKQQC